MANYKFIEECGANWHDSIRAIFGRTTPQQASWSNREDICLALNTMSGQMNSYIFFPGGGGSDLAGAQLGKETGTIQIKCGTANLLKPRTLTFRRMPGMLHEWSYFFLTSEALPASGVYSHRRIKGPYEEVTQLPDGTYEDIDAMETGIIQTPQGPQDLPKGSRSLARYTGGGNFVIFCKGSIYNIAQGRPICGDATDGRHTNMSEAEFHALISGYAAQTH